MNRMVRNTYSNDLVLERLKREREKTMRIEARKDKGYVPLWLKALLGSQAILLGAFFFTACGVFYLAITQFIYAFWYIDKTMVVVFGVGP